MRSNFHVSKQKLLLFAFAEFITQFVPKARKKIINLAREREHAYMLLIFLSRARVYVSD